MRLGIPIKKTMHGKVMHGSNYFVYLSVYLTRVSSLSQSVSSFLFALTTHFFVRMTTEKTRTRISAIVAPGGVP